jgi:hypothetical protein
MHAHIFTSTGKDMAPMAMPAPADKYPDTGNLLSTFEAFMRHCNITSPEFLAGLF